MSDWYSDEALAKQAALRDTIRPKWTDLIGIFEPRTQPTDAERCSHCQADARPEVGGEVHDGLRYCQLCVGRDRHLPD